MKIKYLVLVLLIVLNSCTGINTTKHIIKIKDKTSIQVFKDNTLTDSAVIQGFVYSRYENAFLRSANITIERKERIITSHEKEGTITNDKGFFQYKLNSGIYSIECFHVGHVPEIVNRIDIKSGQRVIIIFELGTYLID